MNIWIFNHYATDMYFDGAGRHQSFAKYLKLSGHDVKIFCASTVHNSDINVDTKGELFIEHTGKDDVPYVFVKTSTYQGNGVQRIKNMVEYYIRLFNVVKAYQKKETPDIILASSVHPLTLVAGIKISRKMGIPCVCEVRDLWPESIVEFTKLTSQNIVIKLLYKLEKWTYKNANSVVFTMEGGHQYIIDKGWEEEIDLDKLYYINNGIDISEFDKCIKNSKYKFDINPNKKNIIYAGSLRPANNVMNLVYAAEFLMKKQIDNVQFFIFGDGPDESPMKKYISENNLTNISLMGRIEKENIPKVLTTQNSFNCMNYKPAEIFRYGGSQNKLFEYLASGRPILANIKMGYDIIEKNHAGIIAETNDINGFVAAIEKISELNKTEYDQMCKNARKTAYEFDFKTLTEKLSYVIEKTIKEYKE